MSDFEADVRRTVWRSRRGLLELDLLLPPFARARYRELDEHQRATYRALLDCEDTDIWAWLQRRSTPDDPELAQLVDAILEFNAAGGE